MQLNNTCRLNEQQLQDGLIRGGGGGGAKNSPEAGYRTSGSAHKITQASLITPLPWISDKCIGRAFLISLALHGLDQTRLRQRNKMARHKQCLKLGGSRKYT